MSSFVYFYSLISNLRLWIELLNVGMAFGDEDTLGRTIGTNKSVSISLPYACLLIQKPSTNSGFEDLMRKSKDPGEGRGMKGIYEEHVLFWADIISRF